MSATPWGVIFIPFWSSSVTLISTSAVIISPVPAPLVLWVNTTSVSSTASRSWAVSTVTFCGVFQLSLVKVRNPGLAPTASCDSAGLSICTTTLPLGRKAITTS